VFDVSDDDHNGADIAMVRDLMAALNGEADFPVTVSRLGPFKALEIPLETLCESYELVRGAVVRRQLLCWVDDNYFCRSTTTTL